MAQRKKKPKPVPAVTGGETIDEPTTTTENRNKDPTEPISNTNDGETIVPLQSTTNGNMDAADVEMNGADNVVTAVSVNTDKNGNEVPTSANPPVSNDAQESVDQEMVVDTDNTDSALVEDTI